MLKDLFAERWLRIPWRFCRRWSIDSWISMSFCSLELAQDLKNWVRKMSCLPPSVLAAPEGDTQRPGSPPRGHSASSAGAILVWNSVHAMGKPIYHRQGCFLKLPRGYQMEPEPQVLPSSSQFDDWSCCWEELWSWEWTRTLWCRSTQNIRGFGLPAPIRTNKNYTLQTIVLGTVRVFLTKRHLQFFQPDPALISCGSLPSRWWCSCMPG